MHSIPDPLVNARHYYRNPPRYALAVDEPWWWPVLALGADVINVHFDCSHRGPLAIVSRAQKPWHRKRDEEAIEAILKGQQRPAFDAYRCPRVEGKVVGLVDVVGCLGDAEADSLWWTGPYGLKVERPCLLPIPHAGSMTPMNGLMPLNENRREAILYALTAMANRHFQPGVERRR